jgi:hypothetical protein
MTLKERSEGVSPLDSCKRVSLSPAWHAAAFKAAFTPSCSDHCKPGRCRRNWLIWSCQCLAARVWALQHTISTKDKKAAHCAWHGEKGRIDSIANMADNAARRPRQPWEGKSVVKVRDHQRLWVCRMWHVCFSWQGPVPRCVNLGSTLRGSGFHASPGATYNSCKSTCMDPPTWIPEPRRLQFSLTIHCIPLAKH